MKGADVAMASIVQYNDWLEEEVCARWRLVWLPDAAQGVSLGTHWGLLDETEVPVSPGHQSAHGAEEVGELATQHAFAV